MREGPSSQPELKTLLEVLHQELSSARTLDPQAREGLRLVLEDVRALLAGEPAQSTGSSLSARIRELALRFTAEHPRLALPLEQLFDVLGKLGV